MKVRIEEMSIQYSQDGDSCDGEIQDIEIKTNDAGGGKYFVIKTERWAVDNVNELKLLLNDFTKRLNLKNKSMEIEE